MALAPKRALSWNTKYGLKFTEIVFRLYRVVFSATSHPSNAMEPTKPARLEPTKPPRPDKSAKSNVAPRWKITSESEEDDDQAGVLGPSGAWTVSQPSLWLVALSLDRCGGGPHLSNVLCGDGCGRRGRSSSSIPLIRTPPLLVEGRSQVEVNKVDYCR